MKKFFTLIACALVAGSAFAQFKAPVELLTNGDIPRTAKGDAAKLPNFVSREFVDADGVATEAAIDNVPSRVVVDPTTGYTEEDAQRSTNRCLEVVSNDSPSQNWDTQFFIVLPKAMKEGDKYTFSMKIRAEKEADSETQTHQGTCGNFIHWAFVGSPHFTTEWETYTYEGTVSSEMDGGDIIAMNLSVFKEANKYYFDDISFKYEELEVSAEDEPQPEKPSGYYIYENDGTGLSTLSVKYFKNYTDAAKSVDGAIVVTSLDPDKSYADLYTDGVEGSEVKLANDWDTQFLITLPYAIPGGEKFHLYFRYKADERATGQTQVHTAAPAPGAIEGVDGYEGTYIHYSFFGNLTFTPNWKWYNEVVTVPTESDKKGGLQSIAFNLNVLRKSINYYFDDIIVAVDELPTAISTFKAEKSSKAIYNVAGQQIKALQKGLNIVNGEKVYVK